MTTDRAPRDVVVGTHVMYMDMRGGGDPAIYPGRVVHRKGRKLIAWFPELYYPDGKYEPTNGTNYQVFTWRAKRGVWGHEGDGLPRQIDSILWFPEEAMCRSCYFPSNYDLNEYDAIAKIPSRCFR